jgi:hypothetical protein
MARELKIEGDVSEFMLLDSSITGREIVTCLGDWGTTTRVELQTQLEVNGEKSPVTTLPVGGTHTTDFSVEVVLGFKSPLFVTVTDYDGAAPIFLKATHSGV